MYRYSDAHHFVNKKVLVPNDDVLFADNKRLLFEPNDPIFYVFYFVLRFFQNSPEKVQL